jgi:hypothetical protein
VGVEGGGDLWMRLGLEAESGLVAGCRGTAFRFAGALRPSPSKSLSFPEFSSVALGERSAGF